MTIDPSQPEPSVPVAPPTSPGPLPAPPHQSAWPTVIGIIAVIFGALGLLGGCMGIGGALVMPLLAEWMESMPGTKGQAAGMEAMGEWTGWMVGDAILGGVLAALLLVAGIRLLQRRFSCRKLCFTWAIPKIPYVIASTVLGYFVQQANLEALKNDPNSPVAAMGGLMDALGVFGTVFGLVLGLAPPVFVLIWFSRGAIKAEVATWGQPAAPPVGPQDWAR